jgi:pilus assembly protein CpaB
MDLGSPLDRRRLAQQLGSRRRLIAALLAGVAVLSALSALRPPAIATVRIWAAARDLAGGAALAGSDVRVERLPVIDVPTGALLSTRPIVGRMLAAPVRRGEALTDVRLLSTALLTALGTSGLVAVPVRVADGPATAALVQPGDRVDVLAAADPQDAGAGTGAATTTTTTVARGLRVLAIPGRADASGDTGGLLVVAATTTQADALAQAATGARLSVAVRGGAG